MKVLDGTELASYIKNSQAHEVRSIVGTHRIKPKMAIVQDNASKLNRIYTRLKQQYADDIGVGCDVVTAEPEQIIDTIKQLNQDDLTHGLIVQLPLTNQAQTKSVLAAISLDKDIDGLRPESKFDPATPLAIMWLLAGYNIDLRGKSVAVIGQGRLVGRPLSNMLDASGIATSRYDDQSQNLAQDLSQADVIISATGQPGLIKSDMVKPGAVVVDAGTASEGATIVGDVDVNLYEREDLIMTPRRGGVGPLTVCALFGNLLRAVREGVGS